MNRSLKLSMLMALALGSSQIMALDLGQVQVKSALGQPLLAEIPLHPANPAELRNLTVQLASSEDFVRAGIAGGRTTIPLHFSVATTGSGQQVIRITSTVAVDDPYLDLLLEVNGKAGKSVREFTILLDPAGVPAQTPAVSTPATSMQSTPSVASHAPAVPAEPRQSHVAAALKPETTPAVAGNGQFGPVQRGQTLSAIARNTAPAGVDVQQMLLALKQANPNAFYRDNINALKTGVVLRVPTSTEAQAMAVAAAAAEVRRENSDWRAGATSKPTTVADAATRASASSSPTSASGNSEDRLALVPAKEGNSTGGQAGSAGGKDDKATAGVRQDLLRAQESVASLQQQSTDLKSRLKDLTDINSKNEHLLSLKDNEIAELQNQLAAARKTAGMPAASTTVAKPVATEKATPATPALAGSVAPAMASTAAASKGAEPAAAGSTAVATSTTAATPPTAASSAAVPGTAASVAAAAKPAPVTPVAQPVIKPSPVPEPWYMQTWAWIAGAGVVVVLLLAMLGRRRKPADAPVSKPTSSLADRFGPTPPASSNVMNTDDIDQNELLDQLAEHPDDIDLHLELVTLYYSRRDVEHFEAAAEAMHAHITDPQQDEWQDVVHMGEDLVPGHPLFDNHAPLPEHDENEARRAFDIDDYAANHGASAGGSSMPPSPPPAPKKVSEYNFNFDLTKPAASDSASRAATDADATVVAPVAAQHHEAPPATSTSNWQRSDESGDESHPGDHGHELGEFTDDPVDTKLDLARAYLDMGDSDGARGMLGEVLKEGSQMQQDIARRLLENLH